MKKLNLQLLTLFLSCFTLFSCQKDNEQTQIFDESNSKVYKNYMNTYFLNRNQFINSNEKSLNKFDIEKLLTSFNIDF
jgi:hypothetical protein